MSRRVRAEVRRLYDLAENCGHAAHGDMGGDFVDVNDPDVRVLDDDAYYRHHAFDFHGEMVLCLLSPEGRVWVTEALVDGDWWEEIAERVLPDPEPRVSGSGS